MLKLLLDSITFVLYLIPFTLLWKYNSNRLKHPDSQSPAGADRSWRLDMLRRDTVAGCYRKAVAKLLDKTAKIIDDEAAVAPHSNDMLHSWLRSRLFYGGLNPWTLRSYTYCLSLSFIYPVFGFLLPWLFGADGSLGNLTLPRSEPGVLKFFLVAIPIISCISGWKYSHSTDRIRQLAFGSGWLVAASLSTFIAIFLSFPVVITIGIPAISAIAAVRAQFVSTITVGMVSLAVAGGFLIAKQPSTAIPIFVGAVVFMLLQSFWHWYWKKDDRGIFVVVVWHVLWVLSVLLLIAYLPSTLFDAQIRDNIQILLVFFILFPLIN